MRLVRVVAVQTPEEVSFSLELCHVCWS